MADAADVPALVMDCRLPETSATHSRIAETCRVESAQLIASLTRIVRDISIAEELTQEALLVALKHWPETGIPDNPGAWLMATAKRRAIDYFRHTKMASLKLQALGVEKQIEQDFGITDPLDAIDDEIGDDLLRLIFTACHPTLSVESRVSLTLRLIGGLTTEEIARAFLVPVTTVAQRIVRAKNTIAKAAIPYEVPHGLDLQDRLSTVLSVIYLVFNEGYAATSGQDLMRPKLCDEALRLGQLVARLAPSESEVHSLVALMQIQASRTKARTGADGAPILLLDQDRSIWDRNLADLGLSNLDLAMSLGGRAGNYQLQAAIAACHARAPRGADTDWTLIATLYDQLSTLTHSPVVELNRAVAHAMAYGPSVGLEIVDEIRDEPALKNYHLLPSIRGDFLFKLGRWIDAKQEFERAAELALNDRERSLLLARSADCPLPHHN